MSRMTAEELELLRQWESCETDIPARHDPEFLPTFSLYFSFMSPDDWYNIAFNFSWDGKFDHILWITKQPDCDLSTAVTIYFMGSPGYYASHSSELSGSMLKEGAELLALSTRIRSGFYKHHNFLFDFDKEGDRILEGWKMTNSELGTKGFVDWKIPDSAFDQKNKIKHSPKYCVANEEVRYAYGYWLKNIYQPSSQRLTQ